MYLSFSLSLSLHCIFLSEFTHVPAVESISQSVSHRSAGIDWTLVLIGSVAAAFGIAINYFFPLGILSLSLVRVCVCAFLRR